MPPPVLGGRVRPVASSNNELRAYVWRGTNTNPSLNITSIATNVQDAKAYAALQVMGIPYHDWPELKDVDAVLSWIERNLEHRPHMSHTLAEGYVVFIGSQNFHGQGTR